MSHLIKTLFCLFIGFQCITCSKPSLNTGRDTIYLSSRTVDVEKLKKKENNEWNQFLVDSKEKSIFIIHCHPKVTLKECRSVLLLAGGIKSPSYVHKRSFRFSSTREKVNKLLKEYPGVFDVFMDIEPGDRISQSFNHVKPSNVSLSSRGMMLDKNPGRMKKNKQNEKKQREIRHIKVLTAWIPDMDILNKVFNGMKWTIDSKKNGKMIITVYISNSVDQESIIDYISKYPFVELIEPESNPRLHNIASKGVMFPNYVENDVFSLPYRGMGEVIGIADTGLDMYHDAFSDSRGSPDLWTLEKRLNVDNWDTPKMTTTGIMDHRKIKAYGRVEYRDMYGSIATDFKAYKGCHGTHVCGSAAGKVETGESPYDSIAKDAKLVFMDMSKAGSNELFVPPLNDVLLPWFYDTNGVRIVSFSWGIDNLNYDSWAQAIDKFIWEHKDMVVLIAVGNDGMEWPVSSPAIAKNILGVGACTNGINYFLDGESLFDRHDVLSKREFYDSHSVAGFSSTGPTIDGRIKPDILAPGSGVKSANAGTKSSQHTMHGTSMATPLLASVVALLRQYVRERFLLNRPPECLIRSMIIAASTKTASEVEISVNEAKTGYVLREVNNNPNHFTTRQGAGVVNLGENIIKQLEKNNALIRSSENPGFMEEDVGQIFMFKVSKPLDALKIVYAWTDPPGDLLANTYVLVNDITLTLTTSANKVYYAVDIANMGNEELQNQQGGDFLNNIRGILIYNVPAGEYFLEFRTRRLVEEKQPYSFVVVTYPTAEAENVISTTFLHPLEAVCASSETKPCNIRNGAGTYKCNKLGYYETRCTIDACEDGYSIVDEENQRCDVCNDKMLELCPDSLILYKSCNSETGLWNENDCQEAEHSVLGWKYTVTQMFLELVNKHQNGEYKYNQVVKMDIMKTDSTYYNIINTPFLEIFVGNAQILVRSEVYNTNVLLNVEWTNYTSSIASVEYGDNYYFVSEEQGPGGKRTRVMSTDYEITLFLYIPNPTLEISLTNSVSMHQGFCTKDRFFQVNTLDSIAKGIIVPLDESSVISTQKCVLYMNK
jgi:subtilisin family serine protease